ncbi:PLA1A Phospholipase, partial [Leiothrix lutea]|nr:PLA1A Phospholipase [Leiothrix lutea]
AGNTDRPSGHLCNDFQTANFLRGSKLKVQFLLFTSSSPSCGELISADDGIENRSFNSSLETKIVIHGFRALGTKPSWIEGLVQAILHTSQVNVVAVDWVYGSTGAYPSAVENVTQLALAISKFISKLLVSYCAFPVQAAWPGSCLQPAVSRILVVEVSDFVTALDPAGPKYTRASPEERLDPGDALFVEAIHTDADTIRKTHGFFSLVVFFLAGYKYLICDHMRAVDLYISALNHPCPIVGFPCASHRDFLNGHCLDCAEPFLSSCPRIGLLEQAGVNMSRLPREVKVFLMTSPSPPFCVHHSLVEFHLLKKRNRVTSIEISFSSNSTKDTAKITIPKDEETGKHLLAHRVPLCQINTVTLKYIPKNHFWSKDEPSVVGKFCVAPLPLSSSRTMSCLPWSLTLPSRTDISYDLSTAC